MPTQINSYSLWLAAQQNPQCPRPGPTGPSGNNGSTGATGPMGPAGQNGVSVGQNYFFNLSGNIITNNTGPTGGNLDIYSYNAGQNTAYTGSDYFGYFIQQRSATAATGAYVNVARFTSVPGLQSPIPRGVWTFYNNIYSFTGPTGTIGTWAIPPPPGTTNEVYAQVSYVDGPTGGKIFQTSPKNINLSDDLVILNGYVQSPITLNNPTGAYFYVDYFATNPTSGNVIEFWTQGNSVAYVTTTFSPQQGSQGATGATGPQGLPGPQGPAGTTPGSANRLAWFPTNNNVTSTPGITTDGNNLTVTGSLVAPSINNLGSTTLAAFTSTGNSSLTGGASLTVSGVTTLDGGLVSNGTTYLKGQTLTQAIASTKLDVTGVSTLVGGLISNGNTFLSGQTNTQAIAATSLIVTGALTSGLGSFGATNPPVSLAPSSQWVLGVFGGWRVAFGWQTLSSNAFQINFTTAFAGVPIVLVSNSTTGPPGDLQIVRACEILPASFDIRAFTTSSTGGGSLNVAWLAIGPA